MSDGVFVSSEMFQMSFYWTKLGRELGSWNWYNIIGAVQSGQEFEIFQYSENWIFLTVTTMLFFYPIVWLYGYWMKTYLTWESAGPVTEGS